ncbi:MAG: DUF58 domain-containing protein [Polyangiaceae bacterium]|nr:DUF58 domain-containing protein [Polyangiaceae bacterium]
MFAGHHRSKKHGPGVEFGGHRPYVPGDDLRWIDRHALMRHNRLIVRLFETETDRSVYLLLDATASMSFRGKDSPTSKIGFAALIAAVLARVAIAQGDPVALNWIGGKNARPIPPSATAQTYARIVDSLETLQATGAANNDINAFDRLIQPIAHKAPRGACIILISDLLDLPDGAIDRFAALGTHSRRLVALQILDSEELTFPYTGTIRLTALEGDMTIETNANSARDRYLNALESWTQNWSVKIASRAGRLIQAATHDDPVDTVIRVLNAIAETPS